MKANIHKDYFQSNVLTVIAYIIFLLFDCFYVNLTACSYSIFFKKIDPWYENNFDIKCGKITKMKVNTSGLRK
jgi:hypothetical protein